MIERDLGENINENGIKKCPFCAEKIKTEAILCKYCNSSLNIDDTKNVIDIMDFISTNGRINRKNFIFYGYVFPLLAYLLISTLLLVFSYENDNIYLISPVFIFIIALYQVPLVVRRLHDLDRPGSDYLMLLIPIMNIYLSLMLIFQDGTFGTNNYGDRPKDGLLKIKI